MRRLSWVLPAVVALGFLACSSGSGSAGGGSSSPPGTCESVCSKALELSCPNDTQQSCVSQCQADFGAYDAAGCSSVAASQLGCIQTKLTWHCGSDGEASIDSQQLLSSCKSESIALAGCIACVQDSNDDSCDTCRKTSCCAEWKASLSDPAVIDASLCAANCTDAACASACFAKYPGAKTKMTTLQNCTNSKCPGVC